MQWYKTIALFEIVNDNQGRVLASLECYANKFCSNNLGYKKDNNQLRGQLIVQTQLFRITFMDYNQKFEKYKNVNICNEQLLVKIKNWMNKVNDNNKIIHQEMFIMIQTNSFYCSWSL